jgi:hypothetical protein
MAIYRVLAYSPSLNQLQVEVDLINDVITDPDLAQRRADTFAARYNQWQYAHAIDWIGRIEALES